MTRHPIVSSLAATLLLVTSASLAGCAATLPAGPTAIDRVELVKSATFDHSCPEDEIRVLAADHLGGGSRFVLDVCGTRRTYKKVGGMYVDAERDGEV
jgi:hypothetical protein